MARAPMASRVDDVCDECGHDGRDRDPSSLLAEVIEPLPSRLRELILSAEPGRTGERARAGEWSPTEYLGHLKDVMAYHRWLIEKGAAEDVPDVVPTDPDASVAEHGYLDADPGELVGQIERRVARLAALAGSLDTASLSREVVAATGRRDLDAAIRNAAHEAHHHLGDLERLVRGSNDPDSSEHSSQ
jgi:hypothetical protein